MCWAFVDSWLMDPTQEAVAQARRQHQTEYFLPVRSSHERSRNKKRTIQVVKKHSTHSGRNKKTKEPIEEMYEYIPAVDEKPKISSSTKTNHEEESPATVNSQVNDSQWLYVPAAASEKKSTKQASNKTSSKNQDNKMEDVGTAVVNGDDDYGHWPDDATQLSGPSTAAGYNGYNGLREFQYDPANEDKKKADAPEVVQPVPYAFQPPAAAQAYAVAPEMAQLPGYAPFPGPQYINPYSPYAPQMAYPAPAYYGLPNGGAMPYCPPGYTPFYMPAPAAAATPAGKKDDKKDKTKKPEIRKWQGRTKAEVEEDNMRIAKVEGAWDARKVEPVGLKADQMVWVVEGDGSPTLRAYATVKELKGEWKKDPRFDSWYFVCEEEEKKEKKKKCSC